jgi:hypothetical protein
VLLAVKTSASKLPSVIAKMPLGALWALSVLLVSAISFVLNGLLQLAVKSLLVTAQLDVATGIWFRAAAGSPLEAFGPEPLASRAAA